MSVSSLPSLLNQLRQTYGSYCRYKYSKRSYKYFSQSRVISRENYIIFVGHKLNKDFKIELFEDIYSPQACIESRSLSRLKH